MKKILGWIFVALLIAGVAGATVVKDKMTYENVVTFIGGLVNTGTLTQTGDVGVTGNVSTEGAYIGTPYFFDSSGVTAGISNGLTWDADYGNTLILSGTTASFVNLPAITAAMDGYKLTIKNADNAVVRGIVASGTTAAYTAVTDGKSKDYIEATQGTLSGVSDINLDAAGDIRTWVAIHKDSIVSTSALTGVTSVWMLLMDER